MPKSAEILPLLNRHAPDAPALVLSDCLILLKINQEPFLIASDRDGIDAWYVAWDHQKKECLAYPLAPYRPELLIQALERNNDLAGDDRFIWALISKIKQIEIDRSGRNSPIPIGYGWPGVPYRGFEARMISQALCPPI
jgi:hypothetical protein